MPKGGKRPGAGRPKGEDTVTMSFRIKKKLKIRIKALKDIDKKIKNKNEKFLYGLNKSVENNIEQFVDIAERNYKNKL